MPPFRRLGSARKFTIVAHTIVCWDQNEAGEHQHESKKQSIAATGCKGSSISELRARSWSHSVAEISKGSRLADKWTNEQIDCAMEQV
jgi:hypothetical protein